jgi:hypothetical protein
MRVEFLEEYSEAEYDHFLLKSNTTLLYASNKFRKFLKDFLGADDYYLLVSNRHGEIIGILPTFLMRNDKCGNILNSLPFYGSIGGIIEHHTKYEVKKILLNAFDDLAKSHNCMCSTIITSPFETNIDFYQSAIQFDYRDERIGQLTRLPQGGEEISETLLSRFESVRRRNIRKAIKKGVSIQDGNKNKALEFLADTHVENIRAINGIPKPKRFFELLKKYFEYGSDYRISIAIKDSVPIAGLLLFYFNKTVEYYTPAVVEEFRGVQPLSLLIFEAMKDAARRGFEWWNWGGTWHNQRSLYDFKKRWGTEDSPYYYYVKTYNDLSDIRKLSISEILKEYPYFYVIPFSQFEGIT